MQNQQAGDYEQPATIYLEVEGQLIEKSVTLKGQALPTTVPTPADAAAGDQTTSIKDDHDKR
ncbi:MAG: hypothetical protein JNL67_15835 [Planctomycetaceae bacterium]|nr:hypothetical protein [Planctomycetaceae bacterium]